MAWLVFATALLSFALTQTSALPVMNSRVLAAAQSAFCVPNATIAVVAACPTLPLHKQDVRNCTRVEATPVAGYTHSQEASMLLWLTCNASSPGAYLYKQPTTDSGDVSSRSDKESVAIAFLLFFTLWIVCCVFFFARAICIKSEGAPERKPSQTELRSIYSYTDRIVDSEETQDLQLS